MASLISKDSATTFQLREYLRQKREGVYGVLYTNGRQVTLKVFYADIGTRKKFYVPNAFNFDLFAHQIWTMIHTGHFDFKLASINDEKKLVISHIQRDSTGAVSYIHITRPFGIPALTDPVERPVRHCQIL